MVFLFGHALTSIADLPKGVIKIVTITANPIWAILALVILIICGCLHK